MKKIILSFAFVFIMSFITFIFFGKFFSLFQKNKILAQNSSNYSSPKNFKNILINSLLKNSNIKEEKDIPISFCKGILSNKNTYIATTSKDRNKGNFIYSPFMSVWTYGFCSYILGKDFENYKSFFPNEIQKLGENLQNNFGFKQDFLEKYNAMIKGENNNINNILIISKNYFHPLLNDYFNNKVKNILSVNIIGADNISNSEIEEAIKQFSKKYFVAGKEGCNDKELYFIGKKEVAEKKDYIKASCSHPETYKYLEKLIKELSKKKSKIIQNINTKLDQKECIKAYEKLIKNKKNLDKKSLGKYYLCGFISFSSDKTNDLLVFQNIILNEFLNYLLWLNYYKAQININKGLNQFEDISIQKSLSTIQNTVNNINTEINITIKTITKSFNLLYNIQYTFPIHVANRIYLEDLKKYRKALVKIYTPIHQLYYKLQNVQDNRR